MKRYRYITCGIAEESDAINVFRLVAGNNLKPGYDGQSALRVNIPDDLFLNKWDCDSYSTTEDFRKLSQLGYDVIIWNKKKRRWIIHNELKGIRPCDFHRVQILLNMQASNCYDFKIAKLICTETGLSWDETTQRLMINDKPLDNSLNLKALFEGLSK